MSARDKSPNALMEPCRITLGAESWEFDESKMTTHDYRSIKSAVGLTRLQFVQGIIQEDPDAQQALIWFLRNRISPGLRFEHVVFSPADLDFELLPDADPSGETVPGATTQPETETSTSSSSTPSAGSAPSTSTP